MYEMLKRMSIDLIKEDGFKLKKGLYPSETMTDADYEDDLALLAYMPAQADPLLYCLVQAVKWMQSACVLNKKRLSPL